VAERLLLLNEPASATTTASRASAVLLRRLVLRGTSEIGARGMGSPPGRRDVERRDDVQCALDVPLGARPIIRQYQCRKNFGVASGSSTWANVCRATSSWPFASCAFILQSET